MTAHQANQGTLIGVALAAAVAIVVGQGPFSLWSTITGTVLLLFLHAFKVEGQQEVSGIRRYTYSAVWALCALLIIGFSLNYFGPEEVTQMLEPVQGTENWKHINTKFNPFNLRDSIGLGFWFVTSWIVYYFPRMRENYRRVEREASEGKQTVGPGKSGADPAV